VPGPQAYSLIFELARPYLTAPDAASARPHDFINELGARPGELAAAPSAIPARLERQPGAHRTRRLRYGSAPAKPTPPPPTAWPIASRSAVSPSCSAPGHRSSPPGPPAAAQASRPWAAILGCPWASPG